MEFWLVTLVRICRTLTGSRIAPKQIKLRHFRPETPPDFRSQLGCEIDFAADSDEILFPSSIGALPLVGADPHLNRLLLQYADEALVGRASRRASVRSRVEGEIAQLLPHGKASALTSPPAWYEPSNACPCPVGRGGHVLGRPRNAATGACETLSSGTGFADLGNRVVAGLQGNQLLHACFRSLDRLDTQGVPQLMTHSRLSPRLSWPCAPETPGCRLFFSVLRYYGDSALNLLLLSTLPCRTVRAR